MLDMVEERKDGRRDARSDFEKPLGGWNCAKLFGYVCV